MVEPRENLSGFIIFIVLSTCIIGLFIVFPLIPHPEKNNTSDTGGSLLKNAIPPENRYLPERSNGLGIITFNVKIPEAPESIPLYWGTFQNGDSLKKTFQSYAKIRFNVTSEKDAPDASLDDEPYYRSWQCGKTLNPWWQWW